MERYLCQLCHTIVSSGENHPCFFYMNNDNVYSLPQLDEFDEMHKNHDEAKDEFTAGSNDSFKNLCPEVLGNDIEELKQLITEYSEKVSFLPALNRKRRYSSSSDGMNSKKSCPEVIESKNIFQPAKLFFQSALSPENKESNKDAIDTSNNLPNGPISLEATSWDHNRNENEAAAVQKPHVFMEDANAVAGRSRIYPNTFRTADKGKLACDLCLKEFLMKSEVDEHYRSHMNANDVAGFSGTRRPSLKQAVKTRLTCDFCRKEFQKKRDLDNHYCIHTGEKPFVCDICKKVFSLKSNLKTHAWTHKNEKPFMCNKCEKGFAHQAHLDRHYRTHTGEKPFVCDKCGKSFSRKSILQRHFLTHT